MHSIIRSPGALATLVLIGCSSSDKPPPSSSATQDVTVTAQSQADSGAFITVTGAASCPDSDDSAPCPTLDGTKQWVGCTLIASAANAVTTCDCIATEAGASWSCAQI